MNGDFRGLSFNNVLSEEQENAADRETHWSKGRLRWYANSGEPDENGRRREVFAPESI
jgi:hypothetical protein